MKVKKKEHLPVMGVGPVYGIILIGLTVLGIVLSERNVIPVVGCFGIAAVLRILGIIFVVFGILLWYCAVIKEKIDDGIVKNRLVTTGIYGRVRNPIYSDVLAVCTGILMIYANLCLLLLPFVYWGFLTVLMKNTEEKWLKELYGEEYEEYCRRVNRCIPWKRSMT